MKKKLPLIRARELQGWTQQDLADQLNVSRLTVGRWERGEMSPQRYHIEKLCEIFATTEQELGLVNIAQGYTPEPSSSHASSSLTIYDPAVPISSSIELIGREHDIHWIKQRLVKGGSVALTAINGIPGVGKTALAITIAHDPDIRDQFHDGVLWAPLGPKANIFGILSHWGHLLGISEERSSTYLTIDAWITALRAAIGLRSLLLVIDDAWRLEDALAFQVGGPNCAILLTTRFPQIASHLSHVNATMIHELNEEESIRLLNILAPQAVAHEPQKVRQLVRAVGGLPLALTLIGNYLRSLTYIGPVRRLSIAMEQLHNTEVRLQLSQPHIVSESHPSLPAKTPLSLQSILAVTDQRLSKTARTTLYALSVFPAKPDSFSEEAALAVAECSLDDLDELLDAGFLESTGNRYRLHQIIADYARLQLKQTPGEAFVYDRLFTYMTDYFEINQLNYELLEQESSNMLATLEIAYQRGHHEALIRGVCALAPFLILRGFYELSEQHVRRAYAAAQTNSDDPRLVDILLYLGTALHKQCRNDQASHYYLEGLALAREQENIPRICDLLHDLGSMSCRLGEYQRGEEYLQEGLRLAQDINDLKRMSKILKILGFAFASLGEFEHSLSALQQGLELARQVGDRELMCIILGNLGASLGEKGMHTQAKVYFLESVEIARQIGYREQICITLLNLGFIGGVERQYTEAEAYLRESLALARQMEHKEWISAILYELSVIAQKQHQVQQSEQYIQESYDLARQINRPKVLSLAYYQMGNLALDRQELVIAKRYYQQMFSHIPEGDQELYAWANYGLAQVAAAQGNMQEARKHGETSCTILETKGYESRKEIQAWFIKTFAPPFSSHTIALHK